MSDAQMELGSESEEEFSRLLDAYHAASSAGTLTAFWKSQNCSPETRARLIEIGSAIHDVELYFASTLAHEPVGTSSLARHKTVGGYRIEQEIGQGSNGTVYLAFDSKLNRQVAIKVPHRRTPDSSSSQLRFRREAEIAAGVDHPHILPIFELGTFHLEPESVASAGHQVDYIVSAYCPGPNLRQWLDENSPKVPALTAEQAAELVLRLSEGLNSFHTRNILHRDIKPANVMLFPVPCGSLPFWPKLADFGLAKDLDEIVELTNNHECVGTPRYMAVEQLSKSKLHVGTATDVYALGVLLFELLASRPPFDAGELATLFDQIRHAQPPGLRSLCSSVPRDLEAICMKCLQKDLTLRYATAHELAEDLRRFLSGQPVHARAISTRSSGVSWVSLAATALFVSALTLSMLQLSKTLSSGDRVQVPTSSVGIQLDASGMDGSRFSAVNPRVYVAPMPSVETGPLTIETWICPSYPRGMVLNYGGVVSLFSDDGLAWTGPSINLMLPNSPMLFLHAETTLVPEKWSHVASVFAGDSITIYINGQKAELRIYSEDAAGQRDVVSQSEMKLPHINHLSGNGKLAIGGNFPGAFEKYRYPFNGSIASVRISKIARYTNNFVPTHDLTVDDATLSLYRFRLSTDSSVVDESQHSATAHLSVP